MSGIESAGIILGLGALLLNSLGEPRKKHLKRVTGVSGLRRNLLYQHHLFLDAISTILTDTLGSPALDSALGDPSSPFWTDASLPLKVHDSLGDEAYNIWCALNVGILANIRALSTEFGTLKKSLTWRLLTTPDSRAKELVDELYRNNDHLAQFLTHYITPRQQRTLGASSKITKRFVEDADQIQPCLNADTWGTYEPAPVGAQIFEEAKAIRQLLEQQALDQGPEGGDEDDDRSDAESLYSIESEADSNVSSLSYLPLSIRHADPQCGIKLQEDALVDTGASACVISLTVAHKLGLDIQEEEQTTIRTAVLDQQLPVKGTTHVALRWRDACGNKYGKKTRVFVVYGLSKPILLSHDFINNNPEIWQIAKTVGSQLRDEINGTFFTKLTKDNQREQEAFTADKTQENKNRAAEEKRQKLKELIDRLQQDNQ